MECQWCRGLDAIDLPHLPTRSGRSKPRLAQKRAREKEAAELRAERQKARGVLGHPLWSENVGARGWAFCRRAQSKVF